jgi:CheY-like chemotaxis protein
VPAWDASRQPSNASANKAVPWDKARRETTRSDKLAGMGRGLARILVVVDERDAQATSRLALGHLEGVTVDIASSGQEAIDVAPDTKPDLILLDLLMPGLDGRATLRVLRRIPDTASIPVVLLSNRIPLPDEAQLRAQGVAGVLLKPLDPTTLAQKVREIWDKTGQT